MPKAVHLLGRVYGEMTATDIPLSDAAQARMAELTKGDTDIQPVVVGVGVGKGGRGWTYTAPYLQKFVDQVNTRGMFGIMGHQRDEDLSHQFPEPVTHWLAAKWDATAPVLDNQGRATGDKGVAYFRGVVDPKASDLKRWLRGKAIDQPSIYGRPKLRKGASGELEVYDGDPLSIDWAPQGRAGMTTASVLALGEMDAIGSDPITSTDTTEDPSSEGSTKVTSVKEALTGLQENAATPQQVIQGMGWRATDVLPALVLMDRPGVAAALPRELIGAVAAGEIAAAHKPADLVGALGMKLADMGPLVDKTAWDALQAEHTAYGEMIGLLGIEASAATPAAVLAKVKELNEAGDKFAKGALTARVEKVVASGEMAVAEPLRPMVVELTIGRVKNDADEAAIKTAVAEVKGLPSVKPLIDQRYGTSVVRGAPQTQQPAAGEQSVGSGTAAVGLPVVKRQVW